MDPADPVGVSPRRLLVDPAASLPRQRVDRADLAGAGPQWRLAGLAAILPRPQVDPVELWVRQRRVRRVLSWSCGSGSGGSDGAAWIRVMAARGSS